MGFQFKNNSWIQIPIQVDERALLDIVTPYGALAASSGFPPSPSNPKVTFYCDATTETGSDPDPNFDSDDELVFMAKDCGAESDGSVPNGVIANTCQALIITDPLGGSGYVYLYQNDGSLQQDAGISYVTLNSNLASTSGFPTNASGTNHENTNITTAKYKWHYDSEWVSDVFKIILGNNVDILDRYKSFFADGNCQRHEDAFSEGENAFVTVRSGPIRIIRSFMGAMSGPLTNRTHIFYEGRQDIYTDLRVHHIPSIYDAFDYNSNADGMTYYNELNLNGVIIDGSQDTVNHGDIQWEFITGTQGSISILQRRTTSIVPPNDGSFTSYYDDDSVNPASNCTGDGQAWGTSGVGVIFGTDIHTDIMAIDTHYRTLQNKRIVYVDDANLTYDKATTYNEQYKHPLVVEVRECETLDVGENEQLQELKLYPNPNKGMLSIETNQAYTLRIYNTMGQNIGVFAINAGHNHINITQKGCYYLQFTDYHQAIIYKKLIVD